MLVFSGISFYACNKSNESPDINEKYQIELKMYHASADYRNLLSTYPEATFEDQPIFNANDRLKVIVTNILSKSGEIVKAMTYFRPEAEFNVWYPTLIIHLTSSNDGEIKEMINKGNFLGIFETRTANNEVLSVMQITNNKMVLLEGDNQLRQIGLGLSNKQKQGSGISKIMLAEQGGGLKECLKAADVCATNSVKDMGPISLALCVVELPICLAAIYADCFINEEACLGIKKPLAT